MNLQNFKKIQVLLTVFIITCSSFAGTPVKVTYTDLAGRKVELKKEIKRIVLVRTMDIYYLTAILGKEMDDKLVGVGLDFKSSDIDFYKKISGFYGNLDKLVNLGSIYDDAINIEKVINLDPDIIIADKQFINKSCLAKLSESGLPVVYMDNNSDPFYGPLESIRMLGKMLGKEKKIDGMVDYADKKIEAVLKRVKKVESSDKSKPKLYWECGNVSPAEIGMTDGNIKNSWGYVWYELGADNMGVGSDFQPLNPERVLSENPDIIIIGGANWNPDGNIMRMGFFVTQQGASDHLDMYTKRAGWSELKAVKNKRLYSIHYNLYNKPFGFAGVEAMAKILYPDEFKDLNPEKDIDDFFNKYMPVKFSGTFWASWGKK
jgi:iron complex transport system substrate-binding protein